VGVWATKVTVFSRTSKTSISLGHYATVGFSKPSGKVVTLSLDYCGTFSTLSLLF
jgi:hypothetical protein